MSDEEATTPVNPVDLHERGCTCTYRVTGAAMELIRMWSNEYCPVHDLLPETDES